MFGALRSRDFRAYFLGQTLSGFGSSISGVALAFGVLALTRSATLLGVVVLASRLPVIAFALLGGALGDRFSRRLIMLSTDAARTILQAVTAVLLLTGHATVWSLAALQAGAGIGSALFGPSASGLVANLAPLGQIRQATSLLGVSRSTASIAAVGVSGALVATVGPGAAFALDAATFAASTFSLAVIPSQSLRTPPAPRRSLLADIGEGWQAVRQRSWLLTYSVHLAGVNAIAVSPFLVLGPLIARQHLGGAPAWAAMGVSYAIGGLGGNVIALRWQPRRPMLSTLAISLALTPLLALLAVPAPPWALVPAAAVAGAEATIYNTLGAATVQTNVPDRLRSRASSFLTIGGLAAVPVGMGLAGTAADTYGTGAVLAAGAGWVMISTLLAVTVPAVRRLTTESLPPRPAVA
jgi:MFS family permease